MVKTIKVSDEEYKKIIEARNQLAKRGLDKVDRAITSNEELDVGSFTLGAIAALGALALIYLLSRD